MPKKRRHYSAHVKPTERDMAIFRYTGTLHVVTKDQLHERFWQGKKKQTCSDRLDELVRGGFLHEGEAVFMGKKVQTYWIDRKASLLFPKEERVRFLLGEPPKSHVSHLLHGGMEYDKADRVHGVREYQSENDLRAAGMGGAIPEPADWSGNIGDTPTLVEIDSKHYNGKRLAAKVRSLGATGKQVIWFVYSRSRYYRVLAATRGISNIFVQMSDLHQQ